jgi:DNA polymerase-3 subunit epsilon
MYAVFDTETTGKFPKGHHRIVEIGVVLADESGHVEGEWSTLLNPDRDLGPQRIHGIMAREVLEAPRFEDLAGDLVKVLAGRTLVAHNLPFDMAFLAAEFDRMGLRLPFNHELGVCTMNWSRTFLEGAGRSLPECCKAAGISLTGWHSALSDAMASARLLEHYIAHAGGLVPWEDRLKASRSAAWPSIAARDVPLRARDPKTGKPKPRTGFVANLVDFLPRVDAAETSDPYLAVLDEALSDRYLSADESGALRALAESLSLDAPQVDGLHRGYLEALARVALSDGVLSPSEEADLHQVSDILALGSDSVEIALKKAATANQTPSAAAALPIGRGDMIVFTGDMAEPRTVWLQRAADRGFVPHSGITKKVKLLVAADPDSLSGKAKKARGYGIPVIGVAEFRAALGYPELEPGEFEVEDGWPDERGWIEQHRATLRARRLGRYAARSPSGPSLRRLSVRSCGAGRAPT